MHSGSDLVALERSDEKAAGRALAALAPEAVVDVLLQVAPRDRERLLVLLERPGEVVPLLPAVELTATLRATGLADAGWLLEHATPAQRVAGIDLDVWRDVRLSHARMAEWIDALIEAGEETLAATIEDVDPELWILALKGMADFLVPGDPAEPPEGYETEDGVVWYEPHTDADAERVRAILDAGRTSGQIWQLVWGAAAGDDDVEHWAARWKAARLNDLGFPDHEQAVTVYRPLRVDDVAIIDVGAGDHSAERDVIASGERTRLRVQHALAQLPEARAKEVVASVLSLANAIAVADELPLSEPESLRRAFGKAMAGIELGLGRVARARNLAPDRALDRTPVADLFRIGVTLEPRLGRAKTLHDLASIDEDWAVEHFVYDPDDPLS